MKIIRKAYCTYLETYELDIDEQYLETLNTFLKNRAVDIPEGLQITAEMVKKVCQHDYDDELEKIKITFHYYYSEDTYTQSLNEFISEVINEDLWDCEYEGEFIETNDWEDSIED